MLKKLWLLVKLWFTPAKAPPPIKPIPLPAAPRSAQVGDVVFHVFEDASLTGYISLMVDDNALVVWYSRGREPSWHHVTVLEPLGGKWTH